MQRKLAFAGLRKGVQSIFRRRPVSNSATRLGCNIFADNEDAV